MRSVLQSKDVQEESEEAEGLLSNFSSCGPSPRSMVQRMKDEDEWQRGNNG